MTHCCSLLRQQGQKKKKNFTSYSNTTILLISKEVSCLTKASSHVQVHHSMAVPAAVGCTWAPAMSSKVGAARRAGPVDPACCPVGAASNVGQQGQLA